MKLERAWNCSRADASQADPTALMLASEAVLSTVTIEYKRRIVKTAQDNVVSDGFLMDPSETEHWETLFGRSLSWRSYLWNRILVFQRRYPRAKLIMRNCSINSYCDE